MIKIEIEKLNESGYSEALYGISLNKKQNVANMPQVALQLAPLDHGHNKYLEHIFVWLRIRAPRYWWAEADTYRLTSKSSESTMHTLKKELRDSTYESFAYNNFEDPNALEKSVYDKMCKFLQEKAPIHQIKQLLPESFLQQRMWVINYKNIKEIMLQRKTHALPHWPIFCNTLLRLVNYPELLSITI